MCQAYVACQFRIFLVTPFYTPLYKHLSTGLTGLSRGVAPFVKGHQGNGVKGNRVRCQGVNVNCSQVSRVSRRIDTFIKGISGRGLCLIMSKF